MPSYAPPFYKYPFPKELPCGEPHIKWDTHDLILDSDIVTEVAIPESWVAIDVNNDGKTNRTKRGYSLVMPRMRTIGCDTTRFVPVYRNKTFETSNDTHFKDDTYYLEYLGAPSAHDPSHACHTTYHLLSVRWHGTPMQWHKLAKYEGNDWLMQFFAGGTEHPYEMDTREPLAETEVFRTCDGMGRHKRYNGGKRPMYVCDWPEYVAEVPMPCDGTPWEEVGVPAGRGGGAHLGLVVGLPVGIVGAIILVALGVYFGPRLRKRFRREGAIRL